LHQQCGAVAFPFLPLHQQCGAIAFSIFTFAPTIEVEILSNGAAMAYENNYCYPFSIEHIDSLLERLQ